MINGKNQPVSKVSLAASLNAFTKYIMPLPIKNGQRGQPKADAMPTKIIDTPKKNRIPSLLSSILNDLKTVYIMFNLLPIVAVLK